MSSREKLDKPSLLEAAAALADERGLGGLTLASLADVVGVRTPSLYHYIDGLGGLHRDLAVYGLAELSRRLEWKAVGKEGGQALEAMLWAYRDFARARPGVYACTLRAPDAGDAEWERVSRHIVDVLLVVLAPYGLSDEDAVHAVRAFRSLAHGFVSLDAIGAFGMDVDLDESYRQLIAVFLLGLDERSRHTGTGGPE